MFMSVHFPLTPPLLKVYKENVDFVGEVVKIDQQILKNVSPGEGPSPIHVFILFVHS
jgi:hypothetical protein